MTLRITPALIMVILIGGCGHRREAPSGQGPLRRSVSNYEISGSNFVVAFGAVAQKYNLPNGFELDRQPDDHGVSGRVAQGTIADVLDAITAQAPGYKWVENDGVVNLMPRNNSDSILNLRIPHFQVHDTTATGVRETIGSLPEVHSWLTQNHVTERSVSGLNGPVGAPAVASLDVTNLTLREILNRIVIEPGFFSWAISRYGDHNQYLDIGID